MEAKDVIQLLRLQRHDLMNDLQIIHGYLSMGKIDKVKSKVNDIIEACNQERVLMNINCPNFALWLIQVNLHHKHIQFTYDIHTENRNLHGCDCVLTEIGNVIIDCILTDNVEIITGELQLINVNNSIELTVTLSGQTINCNDWKNRMTKKLKNVLIQVEELESNVMFTFSISSPE